MINFHGCSEAIRKIIFVEETELIKVGYYIQSRNAAPYTCAHKSCCLVVLQEGLKKRIVQ